MKLVLVKKNGITKLLNASYQTNLERFEREHDCVVTTDPLEIVRYLKKVAKDWDLGFNESFKLELPDSIEEEDLWALEDLHFRSLFEVFDEEELHKYFKMCYEDDLTPMPIYGIRMSSLTEYIIERSVEFDKFDWFGIERDASQFDKLLEDLEL